MVAVAVLRVDIDLINEQLSTLSPDEVDLLGQSRVSARLPEDGGVWLPKDWVVGGPSEGRSGVGRGFADDRELAVVALFDSLAGGVGLDN